jgi:hypothetical protein
MKRYRWVIVSAAILMSVSAALFVLNYQLFRDSRDIFFYLTFDIAYLPIEILVVAIIVERMLARHERGKIMHKLNMVIGTFFSELGTRLLGALTPCVEAGDEIRRALSVNGKWTAVDYRSALVRAHKFDYMVRPDRLDLQALKKMLVEERGMLVMLLGNPNLLEHERFTDLLWAIFHLMEELEARPALTGLPRTDLDHIAGDVQRVYSRLTVEWLLYCRHLQKAYPYIFSIIARTHPLQENPSAIVR